MRSLWVFMFALVFMSCGIKTHNIKVGKWIETESERNRILRELVIHTDKLAPDATLDNRDSSAFAPYYNERVAIHEFANYYIKDSVCYFQIYKQVPSLFDERIAIAGKLKTDGHGKITEIEQVYITPKLNGDELKQKSEELFIALVENDQINRFVSNKAYVEFPDSLNVYDKKQQRWVFKHEAWFGK